ncbi:hypothetical protein [Streptomyces sp. CC208A]|uniref:hypothetical protein n=1 Tax=Streptomyces sp. CC208A TaxID=3044573 RepID=UPI0024A8B5BF|nr:hypothetical protein [Streptomyces sp. CC208A]
MHADVHHLLHRMTAAEAHRKAAAATRPTPLRVQLGRRLVTWGLRLSGPADLTVTLAA